MVKNANTSNIKYSKIYESNLTDCEFFKENNITAQEIISPIEDMITEEFIDKLISGAKDVFQKGKQVVKNIATKAKNFIMKFASGVKDFFKNFSITKMLSGIVTYVKKMGSKLMTWLKSKFSGLVPFIMKYKLVDQNNKPVFSNIWTVICNASKKLINWKKEGIEENDLKGASSKIQINEADKNDISDREVANYGFFVKVVHALGIKNARFNGVVSEIMKKGTIGLAIMGIIKLSGFSLGGALATLGIGLTLSPVAMAAIGGMLLMAGLIILGIWICKPYPTVDDCLKYLHIAFSDKLQETGLTSIFYSSTNIWNIVNITVIGGSGGGDRVDKGKSDDAKKDSDSGKVIVKSSSSLYALMISNLKSLRSIVITIEGIIIQGDKVIIKEVPRKEKGVEGKEGSPKTGPIKTSVAPIGSMRAAKESRFLNFSQFGTILEEKTFGKSRNVEVTGAEEHLTQSVKNVRNSIKVLKDAKDKGIGIDSEFLGAVLEAKNTSEGKDAIKNLYNQIYSYLYGKNAGTLSELSPLYKESIQVLQNKSKSQVVAEKIARFSKRSLQFEGENLYGGLGEFGADLKDFNKSLKEIMDSMKKETPKSMKVKTISGVGKDGKTLLGQELINNAMKSESLRYIKKFNN